MRCLAGRPFSVRHRISSCVRLAALALATLEFAVPTGAGAQNCALKKIAELPMTENGFGHPIVPIAIDGRPYDFLLDTGGFWSILSLETAAAGRKIGNSGVEGRLGLEATQLEKAVRVKSLQIGPLSVANVDFFVDPPGGGGSGKFDGTIGANLLKAFDIEIDQAHQKVVFFSQDHCPGKVVYWPHADLAEVPVRVDSIDHRLTVQMLLDGKEVTTLIDTGSSMSFLNVRAARRLFDLTPEHGLIAADDDGLPFKTYRYPFKSLEIDGIIFKNPRLTVAANDTEDIDLILGMSQLRNLHLYFAYKEGKLYATSVKGDQAEEQANAGGRN